MTLIEILKEYKMKKKLLALIIAATAISACAAGVGLVGCKTSGDNSGKDSQIIDNTKPTKSEFTVTFNANGGKFNNDEVDLGDNSISEDGATLTLTEQKKDTFTEPLETPERDGYAFSGWAKDRDGETLWDFESDELKSDTTLYAVWSVTFDFVLSEDESYYIVRGLGGLSGDVEIPETYNKKPVREITEKAFRNNSRLTSIKIADSVFSMGENAFNGCRNLIEVTIGEGVTLIPVETFANCTSLERITLPASVVSIEESAFEDLGFAEPLRSVEEVHFMGNIDDWCSIEFGAKPYLNAGRSVIANPLSNGEAVLYIDGQPATDITINAETVNQYAFYGCGTVNSVTVEKDVNIIANMAFYNCPITELSFADDATIEEIESSAFYNAKITQLTLPDSMTIIGANAFQDCVKLQTLEMGGAKKIGESAFEFCFALTSVDLGVVEEIGNDAFFGDEELTEIAIPKTVWQIGDDCFGACENLANVTFEITSDWIVNGNKTISGETLSTPATAAAKLNSEAGIWEKVATKLIYALSSDGKSYIVRGVEDKNGYGVIYIPKTYENKPVTEIHGMYNSTAAFWYCSGLKRIIIPDSVTKIGICAFKGCSSLTSITIPGSVTSIGSEIFYYCRKLTDIYFGGTMEQWEVFEKNGRLVWETGNFTVHFTEENNS